MLTRLSCETVFVVLPCNLQGWVGSIATMTFVKAVSVCFLHVKNKVGSYRYCQYAYLANVFNVASTVAY